VFSLLHSVVLLTVSDIVWVPQSLLIPQNRKLRVFVMSLSSVKLNCFSADFFCSETAWAWLHC